MILSFRHKGLQKYAEKGDCSGLTQAHVQKIRLILTRLDAASSASQMDEPGYRLHPLTGDRAGEWAVNVSGNWRITFRFEGENALDVNYEDYH